MVVPLAAGWYPDSDDDSQLRWWDGAGWTDERRPVEVPAPYRSWQQMAWADEPKPARRLRRSMTVAGVLLVAFAIVAGVAGYQNSSVLGFIAAAIAAVGIVVGVGGFVANART